MIAGREREATSTDARREEAGNRIIAAIGASGRGRCEPEGRSEIEHLEAIPGQERVRHREHCPPDGASEGPGGALRKPVMVPELGYKRAAGINWIATAAECPQPKIRTPESCPMLLTGGSGHRKCERGVRRGGRAGPLNAKFAFTSCLSPCLFELYDGCGIIRAGFAPLRWQRQNRVVWYASWFYQNHPIRE
jgi:hypothetical protein